MLLQKYYGGRCSAICGDTIFQYQLLEFEIHALQDALGGGRGNPRFARKCLRRVHPEEIRQYIIEESLLRYAVYSESEDSSRGVNFHYISDHFSHQSFADRSIQGYLAFLKISLVRTYY